MVNPAERLHTVEEYYFSKKLKEVSQLIAEGKDIINLGIGSPDLSPPEEALTTLRKSLNDAGAHKYQSYRGIPELREAMAYIYRRHYNVSLNSESQILPLMGSKEGIMHISMAYLNPGDKVLIPNPGYPAYQAVTRLVGARPVFYDLKATTNWLPDLNLLKSANLKGVKLMWVNYPHMPTGARANKLFFEQLTTFAQELDILIINDNPYSFILNDSPLSILKYDNDTYDNCLELNSLSKTFNMAGWRVGMVAGNSTHINNILKVKSNMDSGMFYGLQKGASEALRSSEQWFTSLNKEYHKRRQLIWKLADLMHCTYDKKAAGLFVWAKLPDTKNEKDFTDQVLATHGIFVPPGTIFGSNGKGYIRFSLCASDDIISKAIKRLRG